MRILLLFLLIVTSSCIKEERFISVEHHILSQKSKTKDIIIYGDSNVDVLKRTKNIKNAIYKSFKGKGVNNIPIVNELDRDIKFVFFCIGTNDGYSPDTNSFKRIYKSLKMNYPNAKIYSVSGTHGWGNSKTKPIKYITYYSEMSKYGFESLLAPYDISYFKTSYSAHRSKRAYHLFIIDSIEKISN
jgi:hypothetical protein